MHFSLASSVFTSNVLTVTESDSWFSGLTMGTVYAAPAPSVPVQPVPVTPVPVPETPQVDPDESVPLPTFTPDVNPDTTPIPDRPLLDPDDDPNRFGTCRGE